MSEPRTGAVAVIGMAGRFPGADDVGRYWENLREGVESLTPLSDAQLREAGVPPELAAHPSFVRSATLLEGADLFDAEFFGFAPREAETMDPQHRLFLECAWHAMEDAGRVPGADARVGVFASVTMNSYLPHVVWRNPELAAAAGGYQLMLGNDKDFLSTRVSYRLDLKGPSLIIQTACSSSLVATEVGCRSLLDGQCDMALVGGSSITVPQHTGYLYQEGMIFSPDGHCRPFDAKAAGTRAGHGVGVVVLKRLEDALADGDPIRAVILGAAINNDGAAKIGYTAPSVDGQADVVAAAQRRAGIDPASVGYIEAHGTGTRLGDPIEIRALTQAFRLGTDERRFCAIGSVKSNIGHLDAAAGIAGLIKAVLALENEQIPPSLNFSEPNPAIDFDASPFFVNERLRPWTRNGHPRRAGVSSFGIGGTNAHVVLEEAPAVERAAAPARDHLVVVSARNEPALEEASAALGGHLGRTPDLPLGDVALTTQLGRTAFARRRFAVCAGTEDAARALADAASGRAFSGVAAETPPSVLFMFSGQGSQYPGMGAALYERFQVYRAAVDRCAEILEPLLGHDLRPDLLAAGDPGAGERLAETRITQPALFTVEYALASLWASWGIRPTAMIGHSIGEWVAAHLAGVFSLEDALALVSARGRLMQDLPGGTMFSVSLPHGEVAALLEGDVSMAAVNAPNLCTVSGTPEAMEALASRFEARDVPFRRLHTSHAFHSSMMDPVLEPFRERVAAVGPRAPEIPFVSNVTGGWITEAEATDPGYWAEHIRGAVRFMDGVQRLGADADAVFLEVGPGNTLATFARQCLGLGAGGRLVASLPHPKDRVPADRFALEALGRLWLRGAEVDWEGVQQGGGGRRVSLPGYAFQRKRYWVEPAKAAPTAQASVFGKKPDPADWFYLPSWARSSSVEAAAGAHAGAEGTWLVLSNASPLARGAVARLREAGRDVVEVQVEGPSTPAAGSVAIDPRDPEAWDRLWRGLTDEARRPRHVLHLWTGPGTSRPDLLDPEALERSQDLGFHALLGIARAMGRFGTAPGTRITVATTGLAGVLDDAEVTRPENATLLGPCMVIPAEYPEVDCRLVDLPGDAADGAERVVRSLLDEAVHEGPATLVAYRAGRRWEQRFEPARLEGDDAGPDPLRARPGGVYLITGGTGGLGLAFARELAGQAPCVLGLTGRTPLPPRETWDRVLDGSEDALPRVRRAVEAVLDLEERGAVVVPIAADAADEDAMTAAVESLVRRHGPLTGVIHAAGVPATGVIQLKTREMAASVLDPKVRGTLILDRLVGSGPLDFFVLFSSINAVHAPGGGTDYASANAFLDAFAQHRRARGDGTVVSVNWAAWQEVGMAVDTEVPAEQRAAWRANLESGIPTADGVEALRRVLRTGLPRVVVSALDVPQILEQLGRARVEGRTARGGAEAAPAEAGAEAEAGKRHARPEMTHPYVAARTDDERLVAGVWEGLLGMDRIGVHDNFFELGGHSLLATRVLAQLQEKVHVSLPLEAIFEAPTVAELAERIETLRWVATGGDGSEQHAGEREEFVL